MYIGGTDEKALHHLFAEVIDNSMDEAVAGHADWIEVSLDKDGRKLVMATLTKGDILGEMAIINREARTAKPRTADR